MTARWIVTALGQDRPGMVAGVTKALYELGCNLEDSAMRRLEGEFTIMLIFSTAKAITEPQLLRRFEPLQRTLGLVVHLKPLRRAEAASPKSRGPHYLISVYGADRPGIVFKMSDLLARARVNIIDLHTHRSVGRGPSLYMLILDVELPSRVSPGSLEKRLKRLAGSLGVEVSLRPSEPDVL